MGAEGLFLLPEDGLENLKLRGSVLVDPHVDEFIQPGDDKIEKVFV